MSEAIILRLAYGYRPQQSGGSDRIIQMCEERSRILVACMSPTWLVNLLPFGECNGNILGHLSLAFSGSK
jgi:hypothetical protein